jgi:predicted short-subunit dehydrogenase-like oxidoreductase (DUF2520 family)
MTKPSLGFVGAGRVGQALALAFSQKEYPIIGIASRDAASAEKLKQMAHAQNSGEDASAFSRRADILFLTVPDQAVKTVCDEIAVSGGFRKGQVVAHTSGALGAGILASANRCEAWTLAFHPLQSFSGKGGYTPLAKVYFVLQGDEEAIKVGKELAQALEGIPLVIEEQAKPLYHAGASLLSSGLVALVKGGTEAFQRAGVAPDEALAMALPLLRGTLINIVRAGVYDALTGPIERGDAETIKAHLKALEIGYPQGLTLYRALVEEILKIAAVKGGLSSEAQAELSKLLQ